MSNILKGTQLGSYKIEGLIAEGAMGSIYRASHPDSKHPLAIKVMQPEFSADEDFRKRFNREVGILKSFEHPNIVPIYDYGDDDGVLYFVMPFIDGASLEEVLREQRFSPATAWLLIEPIAQALTYVHQKNVIHRDLKPANIMVRLTNTSAHPYLTDFGLSKPVDKSTLTEVGVSVGTPAYMSPEQVRGTVPVTFRADIYALAIIVYEMLLGRVPFASGKTELIALQQVQEPPPPPHELHPRFPVGLEAVILQALSKDPNDRFENAEAFGAAYFDAVKSMSQQERMAYYSMA